MSGQSCSLVFACVVTLVLTASASAGDVIVSLPVEDLDTRQLDLVSLKGKVYAFGSGSAERTDGEFSPDDLGRSFELEEASGGTLVKFPEGYLSIDTKNHAIVLRGDKADAATWHFPGTGQEVEISTRLAKKRYYLAVEREKEVLTLRQAGTKSLVVFFPLKLTQEPEAKFFLSDPRGQ